jgi:hypothetical protein
MSLDHWISIISALISGAGLVFVALQLRAGTRQRESESLVEIYDINRELLSLGFSHPKLFAVLDDSTTADSRWERYYLQLWFNQYALAHLYLTRSVFQGELKTSLTRDLADFISMGNAQRHWQRFGQFYPASFRAFVDDILKKVEPPVTAAQVKP